MPLAFSAVLPQLVSAKSLQGNLVDAGTVEPFETLFRCRLVTPPPIGERSIVTSVSVCLSVCVFVRDHIFGTTRPIFTNFFVLVIHGRGSVLLWRRSDTLCTSGFYG